MAQEQIYFAPGQTLSINDFASSSVPVRATDARKRQATTAIFTRNRTSLATELIA
jgi:hypothetical protein